MKTSYATFYRQGHRSMSKRFLKRPYSISRATPIDSNIESNFDRLGFLKKNLNASRPPEHPLVRREMSKRLGGIIGCKGKTSYGI